MELQASRSIRRWLATAGCSCRFDGGVSTRGGHRRAGSRGRRGRSDFGVRRDELIRSLLHGVDDLIFYQSWKLLLVYLMTFNMQKKKMMRNVISRREISREHFSATFWSWRPYPLKYWSKFLSESEARYFSSDLIKDIIDFECTPVQCEMGQYHFRKTSCLLYIWPVSLTTTKELPRLTKVSPFLSGFQIFRSGALLFSTFQSASVGVTGCNFGSMPNAWTTRVSTYLRNQNLTEEKLLRFFLF